MNLLELPDCMLMEIFECLTFEEVSKNRLVCRRINQICQQVLNGGFSRAVRQHSTIFKRIKSMLPRRESERRNHSLARHADILTSIETRISMLSMTYCKYIDLNLCCFIPGRVLDEIFRILSLVSKTRKTLRPHEVLQEFRDISSMAIEHFDEKIANLLKSYVESSSSSRSNAGGIDNKRITSPSSGLGSISFSVQPSSSSMWPQSSSSPKIWTRAPPLLNNTCNDTACETILNRMAALINMKSPNSDSSDSPDWDSVYAAIGCCGDRATGDTSTSNEQSRYGCPEAKATMAKYKKLELEYKNGVQRMNRMQQIQVQQSRRLQYTMNTITTLNTQLTEFKKRLEDLDAKNREISANIKQINPSAGELTNTAPSSTEAVATNVDSEDHDSDDLKGPSVAKKRRCDVHSTLRKRKFDVDEKAE